MDPFPVPLDSLIAYVKPCILTAVPGPSHRCRVAAGQLDEQSDAVIGYFVDQARASGASWSQIGTAMGVSKQAAEAFVARDDELAPEGKTFSRFTPHARASVAAAGLLGARREKPTPWRPATWLPDCSSIRTGWRRTSSSVWR